MTNIDPPTAASETAPPAAASAFAALRAVVSPPAALTLAGVTGIFVLCFVLWDVAWLRPYLAAGGAGLAAFLGPIPGIISPESRAKWLASIFVAAIITAGTWLATRDLEHKLDGAEQAALAAERATVRAERAAAEALAADAAHDAFVTKVLIGLPPAAREALFKTAPLLLWSLYNEKKKNADARDHQIVLDMAQMLLQVERGNGHALYYAGEANAKLGNTGETIRMLQHYLSNAKDQADAKSGEAKACYERANGFCAERTGWVAHILADINLTQALELPDGERAVKLAQAFKYEEKAVAIVKWPADHHHPGFDTGGITKGNSSCKILLTIIAERRRLKIDPAPVIAFGLAFLKDNCGTWPAIGPTGAP